MTTKHSPRYPATHAAANGDKPAIVMAETGATVTYRQLHSFANRTARLFRELGLKTGDHVAFCLKNRIECPMLQWAAHYAGLYYTFISNRLTAAEAAYIVEDCGARVVVVTDETTGVLKEAIRSLGNPPTLFVLGEVLGATSLIEAIAKLSDEPLDDAREGSEMLYSSGTTGRPKGVKPPLTGKALGSTMLTADLIEGGFGATVDTVYLSPAPYYHAAPLKWVQAIIALGGTAVLMQKFNAECALRAIERYRVTMSQWVPTMFHRLLALPDEVKRKYDLSSHTMALHAAAPCPVATKQAMIDWWGPILCEYYSCTEMIGMTMCNTEQWRTHLGTVGRAIFGQIHIVGEDGRELPVGEEGLVYFSGGRPFIYHNDPRRTQEAHSPEGWATVEDIGKLDADGFLYLTDRQSNMIISGGVNVYPQETENVLITHPQVFDVAVIGTPHEDLGEEVRAVVQLEPGIQPSPALAAELITFCRAQLSPIKSPRIVDFRDNLPREPNGKLLKRLLRDQYRRAAHDGGAVGEGQLRQR